MRTRRRPRGPAPGLCWWPLMARRQHQPGMPHKVSTHPVPACATAHHRQIAVVPSEERQRALKAIGLLAIEALVQAEPKAH